MTASCKKRTKSLPKIQNSSLKRPEIARFKAKRPKSVLTKPKKRQSRLKKLLQQSRHSARHALGTQALRDLRDEWNVKLRETGFEDVELTPNNMDDATHYMQSGSLGHIAKQYRPETLHYYRRWSCFMAYCSRQVKPEKHRAILLLYMEGVTFRDIKARLKPVYKKGVSITAIHFLVRKWLPAVMQWNRTNVNGLDFEPDIGSI